jgi:flagellar basal-body rod protein FlgB
MKLFDKTLTTLEHSLDVRLLRQNVLAGNLANADTPGYTPRDVSFEAAMAEAARTNEAPMPHAPSAGHIPLSASPAEGSIGTAATIIQAPGASPGIDGNGVDLDRAMVSLAQNALQYGASAKAAGKKLAILRYVASDGAA